MIDLTTMVLLVLLDASEPMTVGAVLAAVRERAALSQFSGVGSIQAALDDLFARGLVSSSHAAPSEWWLSVAGEAKALRLRDEQKEATELPHDKALRRYREAHADWDGAPRAVDVSYVRVGDRFGVLITTHDAASIKVIATTPGVDGPVSFSYDANTGARTIGTGDGRFPIEDGVTDVGSYGATIERLSESEHTERQASVEPTPEEMAAAALRSDDGICGACHGGPLAHTCDALSGREKVRRHFACGVRAERARMASALAAAEREADRLRHGVPVDGDFVCPDAPRADAAEARAKQAEEERDAWEMSATEAQEVANALRAERDEARAWVRRLTSTERVLTCAFCGEAYPPGTPESNDSALLAHVKVCVKHPMREVEAELADAHERADEWKQAADSLRAELEEMVTRIMAATPDGTSDPPGTVDENGDHR